MLPNSVEPFIVDAFNVETNDADAVRVDKTSVEALRDET